MRLKLGTKQEITKELALKVNKKARINFSLFVF